MVSHRLCIAAGFICCVCGIGGCGKAAPNSTQEDTDSSTTDSESYVDTHHPDDSAAQDTQTSTEIVSRDTATTTGDTFGADPDCVHPEVVKSCNDGWCTIPPGCFTAGSPVDEMGHGAASEIQNQVTLTHAFEIQQFEVTQGQWGAAGFPDPSTFGPNGNGLCASADCPVDKINWYEAIAFANRMSEMHDPPLPACYTLNNCTGEVGKGLLCESVAINAPTIYDCTGYRLPTRYEAEYATRAGTQTSFYSGNITNYVSFSTCEVDDNLDRIAWYCRNSEDRTHPVGQKEPNAWGLFDMAGNVAEWGDSQIDGKNSGSEPVTDPTGPTDVPYRRALRGGTYGTRAVGCRAAYTLGVPPEQQLFPSSTRLVRTL